MTVSQAFVEHLLHVDDHWEFITPSVAGRPLYTPHTGGIHQAPSVCWTFSPIPAPGPGGMDAKDPSCSCVSLELG